MPKFSLTHEELNKALNLVAFSASTEETRYYLCGVCVRVHNGKVQFVSTDGHRLSIYEPEIMDHDLPDDFKEIIANEQIKDLLRMKPGRGTDAGATFEFTDTNRCLVHYHAKTIGHRVIDGSFPDVDRILPDRKDLTLNGLAQFNCRYIGELGKALCAATGTKYPNVRVLSSEGGNGAMLIETHVERYTHVLMLARF